MAAVASGQKSPYSKQIAPELRQRKRKTAGGMAVQRHRAEAWALNRFAGFVAKINARNRVGHTSFAAPSKIQCM
jgi:hypothetical protein